MVPYTSTVPTVVVPGKNQFNPASTELKEKQGRLTSLTSVREKFPSEHLARANEELEGEILALAPAPPATPPQTRFAAADAKHAQQNEILSSMKEEIVRQEAALDAFRERATAFENVVQTSLDGREAALADIPRGPSQPAVQAATIDPQQKTTCHVWVPVSGATVNSKTAGARKEDDFQRIV